MESKHPENSLAWLAERLGVPPAVVYRATYKVADVGLGAIKGRYRIYKPEAIAEIEAEVLREKRPRSAPRDSSGCFVPTMGHPRPQKILISLTDDQYRRILLLAKSQGRPVAELVAEALLVSPLFMDYVRNEDSTDSAQTEQQD